LSGAVLSERQVPLGITGQVYTAGGTCRSDTGRSSGFFCERDHDSHH